MATATEPGESCLAPEEAYRPGPCFCDVCTAACLNCDGDGRTEPGGCPVCGKVGREQEEGNP